MARDEVVLERMTWPEVAAALDGGATTAIVPCGAVEQHGPHLPLFVDAEHATYLGAEVARRLGDALVAPTIRVGCSEHHMAFPGTVSLQPATLKAVLRDYCTSLARHGFRTLCLFSAHGGNFEILAEAVEELNATVQPDATVVAYTDLMQVVSTWRRIAEDEAGLGHRIGGHADVAEGSIMLQLHPDLVHPDRAEAGFTDDLNEDVLARVISEGLDTVTETGILGDARGMNERIGARCIDALADLLTEYFGTMVQVEKGKEG